MFPSRFRRSRRPIQGFQDQGRLSSLSSFAFSSFALNGTSQVTDSLRLVTRSTTAATPPLGRPSYYFPLCRFSPSPISSESDAGGPPTDNAVINRQHPVRNPLQTRLHDKIISHERNIRSAKNPLFIGRRNRPTPAGRNTETTR